MKQIHAGRYVYAVCLLTLLLASAACWSTPTGYDFETDALYTAPISGYDIAIHAAGTVDAGHDLSQISRAQVTITSGAAGGSVTFNVTYDSTFAVTDWPSGETSLTEVVPLALMEAGIENP